MHMCIPSKSLIPCHIKTHDIALAKRMVAAPSTIGSVQEYCTENESFLAYLELVQLFFIANDVIDAKSVRSFLSVVAWPTSQ